MEWILNRWWIAATVIIIGQIAIVLWDAYEGFWYWAALPAVCAVGLTFQQGYYLGKRRGYEEFRRAVTPEIQCVGGPMDGLTIPPPPGFFDSAGLTMGVAGHEEGMYHREDGRLVWVEDS